MNYLGPIHQGGGKKIPHCSWSKFGVFWGRRGNVQKGFVLGAEDSSIGMTSWRRVIFDEWKRDETRKEPIFSAPEGFFFL